MKIKAFVFDLDGTLLLCNGYDIHPETIKVLEEAHNAGFKLIIATGRPLRFSLPLLEKVGHISYIITDDGSNIYNVQTKQSINNAFINKEAYLSMVEKAYETDSFIFVTTASNEYKELNGTLENTPKQFVKLKRGEDFGMPIEWFRGIIEKQPISQITLKNEPDKVEEIMKQIKEETGYKELEHSPTSWYLSIMSPNASKFQSIKDVVRMMNIDISEVMAFGDSDNDIKMLEGVGWGVAVENGTDQAKAAANEIIGDHALDSIAKKIREVISYFK